MEWLAATDTFVGDLADGTSVRVVTGDQFPATHELVKRDKDPKTGSGQLFVHAYFTDDKQPTTPAPRGRVAAAAKGKVP